ncbi:MAG: DUF4935 domain-containing protein [Clostridia bacterium]|nr:DUF4935 domain-containing protein [Clostridia bacterium]
MKIGIITDTNILTKKVRDNNLKLCNQEKYLENMDFFINYIEDIKKINNKVEIVYLMPETIMRELKCQKIQVYHQEYKEFEKVYNNLKYGFSGEMPKSNIDEIVDKEEKEYLNKVKIINLKYQIKIYKELVNEALNKLPPFDKTEQKRKSDSGFKDALIWKTILYAEEMEEFDKIYFFSGDNIFENNSPELLEQFKKIHNNTQLIIKYIEPNNEKVQNCLKTIINENKLPETDCVKLYNKEVILKFINKLEYNFNKTVKLEYNVWGDKEILLKSLLLKNFREEDINILEVKKENDKFVVEVKFETKKYILQPKEARIFPRRNVKGIIKLDCQKEDEEIILKDYKIITVFFQKIFQERAQEWANSLSSIAQFSEMSKNLEALRSNVEPL